MQDLRDPATREPVLACDCSACHAGELEPHDLDVTGKGIFTSELLVIPEYGVFLGPSFNLAGRTWIPGGEVFQFLLTP